MVTEEEMNDAMYRSYQNQNQDREMNQSQSYADVEKGMAEKQLDLTEELERIEHLLRGHIIKTDKETGNRRWEEPKDNEMVVLSEYGIHLILNTITWYINKNTLLSNYLHEDDINHKMEDFAKDLSATIFMEYEKVFQYPSLLDCQKVFEERIKYKLDLKMFAGKTIGIELNEADERAKILSHVEDTIEKELDKIKQQIVKGKLKRFLIIMRCIQDAVHSTYLRAYKGQERRTLREHINIIETNGGQKPQQQSSGWSPLNWERKQ